MMMIITIIMFTSPKMEAAISPRMFVFIHKYIFISQTSSM